MDASSTSYSYPAPDAADTRPILVIPYMWIGDFVRGQTALKVMKARWPNRPIDVLTTTQCAPLLDYMAEVRKGIVFNLRRNRLEFGRRRELGALLGREGYGTAFVMPRTWKAALIPFLAGIPERVGYIGEVRYGVLSEPRHGEKALPRMVDQCAALALPAGAALPLAWPVPDLQVPAAEIATWRARTGVGAARGIALAPGAVGPSKRWPAASWAAAARQFAVQGFQVWTIGGPGEKELAQAIAQESGGAARDLTGTDLRQGVLALAAAEAVISNDSGLLHVAAALHRPSIGIFGPTSPWHWAPLNPLAAVIEAPVPPPCRPCHKPVCREGHHRCMTEISAAVVAAEGLKAAGAPQP